MKANNYDALLTYARLLSELQSGEPQISWQKITPISKQDHLLTRQHLHRLILLGLLLMVTAVPTSLLIFNEQQTVGMLLSIVGMLLGAAAFFLAIAILKTELPDAIRILRAPIGTMQPETYPLFHVNLQRQRSLLPQKHLSNPLRQIPARLGQLHAGRLASPAPRRAQPPKPCNSLSAPFKNGLPNPSINIQAAA